MHSWLLLVAVVVWAVVFAWAWELLDRRDERERADRPAPADHDPMSDWEPAPVFAQAAPEPGRRSR
jgi:hypothetical protein